jgi:hypothetical protein
VLSHRLEQSNAIDASSQLNPFDHLIETHHVPLSSLSAAELKSFVDHCGLFQMGIPADTAFQGWGWGKHLAYFEADE